jgi:hypothetical protein
VNVEMRVGGLTELPLLKPVGCPNDSGANQAIESSLTATKIFWFAFWETSGDLGVGNEEESVGQIETRGV